MSGTTRGAAPGTTTSRRSVRPEVRVLLALAVAVQVVVLYSPDGGGPLPFSQADKVVHVTVFLVPAALAVVAEFRRRVVVAVFAAQAVLSEVVQGVFLPHRTGDVLDAIADLTGVALGVLVGHLMLRARASRGAARPGS